MRNFPSEKEYCIEGFSTVIRPYTVRVSGILPLRGIANVTVCFHAVFRYLTSYGAVRCCDIPYGGVPRG